MIRRANAARVRLPIYTGTHQAIAASQLTAFTAALEGYTGKTFASYATLHDFSVREYRAFWRCFVRWSSGRLRLTGSTEPVCEGNDCEDARFFPRLRLNYADNLLNPSVAAADAPALTACHADGRRVRWTRCELRDRVARLAQALSGLGLNEGDRVVGVMRNDDAAVIAALAVAAVGASLSTAAPEMGVEAIADRFAPLAPRMLLAHTVAQAFDTGMPLADSIASLTETLPSVREVIRLDGGTLPGKIRPRLYELDELMDSGDAERFAWPHFPFNHPLFIMFSSGTTGKPKCIVHGAGGSLLEHLKEHQLHTDLRPSDRLYFHTSCAWMMWNWQLSALASGVEIVTYDGPISTVDKLWRLVAQERITVFGTSPAYLRMCEDAGLAPGRQLDLSALRAVLSTGAVLQDKQFDWVRDHVKPLPLQSISGGTDILGCFVLGNPNLPVYTGEAQCKSLGLDVQAWERGARTQGVGQLVCVKPFPSRPIGFFGDTSGTAFHAAYFSQNQGVWTHGDLIEFSSEGTARLHGRSDDVLNVRGIKIAPAEIYRVLRDIPGIREAMVVEQRSGHIRPIDCPPDERSDQRIVLLLVLRKEVVLTGALIAQLRRDLARRLSAAHVPDQVIAVDELPVTHSGKLSEAAARDAVNGLRIGNAAALRNPGCLDAIRNHPALRFEASTPTAAIESREQLEQHLQTMWERRFGFGPIGRDDNFFELGGNSLLAARLVADVRHSTGRTLPLAALLVAPTILRLASMIEGRVQLPASSMVVPIRTGTGRPLFLIHGLSGSVMECWTLVDALHGPRPVYGLQARGLDGEQSPWQRVEDIAASYIEQMRTVQACGPYAIAGYSFGGLVGLEIAQQLSRTGEQIELLCLLDTYVQQDLPWHAWVRHRYARARSTLGALSLSQIPGYLAARLAGIIDRGPTRIGKMLRRRAAASKTAQIPRTPPLMHEKMLAAMTVYRPQPYHAGPITYVRAAVPLGDYFDPMPLWRRIAYGGLTVIEVPDGHLDLLGPNARLVAAALDRALAATDVVPRNEIESSDRKPMPA